MERPAARAMLELVGQHQPDVQGSSSIPVPRRLAPPAVQDPVDDLRRLLG